jgi:hypothetical protein
MAMRDFKYRQLLTGASKITTMMAPFKTIRSECLKKCATAFQENLYRIAHFARMPADISFVARRETLWMSNARRRAGEPELTLDDLAADGFKPTPEMRKEVEEQRVHFGKDAANEAKYFDCLGIAYTESMLRHMPSIGVSMDAVYSMIIMASWTAFESFAAELWVAGVDNGPEAVHKRLLTAPANTFERAQDNIRPERVYEIGINARTHYGTFLKELGRVSFLKLGKIESYYKTAFGKNASGLFKTIESGYIFALAAFRNVLIHSGVRADEDFVTAIKDFTEFRHINEGDPIELDGEQVRKLSDSAIALGGALLAHVDELITPVTPGKRNSG